MTTYRHFRLRAPRRLGAILLRVAGLGLTALLCQSYFWSPGTPWALKSVVAAIALLAALRPDVGLLILAAVVPFGRVISNEISQADPARFTEAIVLAFLFGWLLHRLRHTDDERPNPLGWVLGMLFAVVAIASLLVEIGVLRYWKDYWWPYAGTLLTHLRRDYLSGVVDPRAWTGSVGGLVSLPSASVLLEGLGLMRAAHLLCAGNPAFGRRLLRILMLAAVGTAILSAGMAIQVAIAEARSLLSFLAAQRIAVHTTKVNTASSSFVLFLPILIGIAVWAEQSTRRPVLIRMLRWAGTAVGAGLLLAAMWIAGSRTALIAGLVVAVGASAHAVVSRLRQRTNWRRVVAVVVACSVVAAFLGYGIYLREGGGKFASPVGQALDMRVSIWRTALRMLTAHPLLGTGIGQFPLQVAAFEPDEALRQYLGVTNFNAHNQFLQVAAELGLIGGALFVGMFAAILWRAWTAFRKSRDALVGGVIAGLVGFLMTCLAGQPLYVEVVAFPFWMVLGVALAAGDTSGPALSADLADARRRRRSRLMVWFLAALAVSIPVRVWQGQERVNFALADYGFSDWHDPIEGRSYSLVRDKGTFFTYGLARWLELSVRRDIAAGRNRLEVDISLEGRRARTLTLTDDEWQTVTFMIPAAANRRFRRIDLEIRAPASVAAQIRVARPVILRAQTLEQRGARAGR